MGGGQKHAFQEDSAFANADESQLERTISSDTTIPGVAHLKKRVANLSASVRQRLLNQATEHKEDFGLVVTRYGLERFLYRLSVSPHRDSFVLKGAPARMVRYVSLVSVEKLPDYAAFDKTVDRKSPTFTPLQSHPVIEARKPLLFIDLYWCREGGRTPKTRGSANFEPEGSRPEDKLNE